MSSYRCFYSVLSDLCRSWLITHHDLRLPRSWGLPVFLPLPHTPHKTSNCTSHFFRICSSPALPQAASASESHFVMQIRMTRHSHSWPSRSASAPASNSLFSLRSVFFTDPRFLCRCNHVDYIFLPFSHFMFLCLFFFFFFSMMIFHFSHFPLRVPQRHVTRSYLCHMPVSGRDLHRSRGDQYVPRPREGFAFSRPRGKAAHPAVSDPCL